MPNGTTVPSTNHGTLQLGIPSEGTAHVLPSLLHSLLSIGKLCDAGCEAIFTAKGVKILHNSKPILHGQRTDNGLWQIKLPQGHTDLPTFYPQAHFTVYDAPTRHIIRFLHQCLFSPTKLTLLTALKNNHFIGWPTLTHHNVVRFLELEPATIFGHLDQQRQGTQSTTKHLLETQIKDANPDNTKTLQALLSLQDLPTGRVYTNQTGSFPIVSSQGTKSVMILYDYDSNAILVEGITSRNQSELISAYTHLLNRLANAGIKATIQRMDNEVRTIFKQFLITQKNTLELTPAHLYRRNAAERAIRTSKDHLLAGLASLNPRFPLRYWSYLLQQSELTLNLLRQSRLNPKLSAYAQLHGIFDFKKTPLAPP